MPQKAENKPKIVVIAGPTASGKSALAVRIAKAVGGEVVSADSRQVYRGLDIGTGKVTKAEMAGVPHHLLSVADPRRTYSAARFARNARSAIAQIHKRGRVPIVCGGTGFYIDALLGRFTLPDVPPNKALRKQLSGKTAPELMAKLRQLDQARAAAIDPNNRVRIVRAIEVAEALGSVPTKQAAEAYDALVLGIAMPKEALHKRIHARLSSRMRQGMLAEAKRLHQRGLSFTRMEELGLEYRFLARHLQGKISKNEMLQQLEVEIQHYAKRQMTWFKRDKNIVWVPPDATDTAVEIARAHLV